MKKFERFINENAAFEKWKELMNIHDLKLFQEYQTLSKSDLEQMRKDYKVMRNIALEKLNNKYSGNYGTFMHMDVSDDELFPYLKDLNKDGFTQFTFFKYSRILDFAGGYKPKDIHIITKGLPLKESASIDIKNLTEKQLRKLFNLPRTSSVEIKRGDIEDGVKYTKYAKYIILHLDKPIDDNRKRIIKMTKPYRTDKLFSHASPNFGQGVTWTVKW